MNAPAFGQKTTYPNQDNFNWTLPSEEELKLQIERLEGTPGEQEMRHKRFIVGVAYLIPFLVLTLLTTLFAWH